MKTLSEFARINKIEENIFISFDLTEIEVCDQIACGALKLECPDFVMPVLFDYSTSITTMRYSIPEEYTAVKEFQGELQIEEVLTLYQNILDILEMCGDWYLKPEGFYFDTKYAYMNKAHNTFKFIYVPESKYTLDTQQIKYLLIGILEKCKESSGGNIQLQLYKYFYKPKFYWTEFKGMLESCWMLLQKEVKSNSNEVLEETVSFKELEMKGKGKVQVKDELKKDISPRSFYASKVNRSQLSQEEIEEMVKSMYNGKTSDSKNQNASSSYNVQEQINEPNKVEEKSVIAQNSSFYGSKLSDADTINTTTKMRNIFDNMFNPSKAQKTNSYASTTQARSVSLKSISMHTRYDLPKLIEVQFVEDLFVIGRATRTGESTGAHYEFGSEITPISHLHAEIERKEGAYYLQDLGSSNGTFLNGNKIEANRPYLIEDGDKIAFAIAYSKNSIEYVFVE